MVMLLYTCTSYAIGVNTQNKQTRHNKLYHIGLLGYTYQVYVQQKVKGSCSGGPIHEIIKGVYTC